jgi:hypothetical protein
MREDWREGERGKFNKPLRGQKRVVSDNDFDPTSSASSRRRGLTRVPVSSLNSDYIFRESKGDLQEEVKNVAQTSKENETVSDEAITQALNEFSAEEIWKKTLSNLVTEPLSREEQAVIAGAADRIQTESASEKVSENKVGTVVVGKEYLMKRNNEETRVHVIAQANEANGNGYIVRYEVDGKVFQKNNVQPEQLKIIEGVDYRRESKKLPVTPQADTRPRTESPDVRTAEGFLEQTGDSQVATEPAVEKEVAPTEEAGETLSVSHQEAEVAPTEVHPEVKHDTQESFDFSDRAFLKKLRTDYENIVAKADASGRNPLIPSVLNIAIISLGRAIQVYEERVANDEVSPAQITTFESESLLQELADLEALIVDSQTARDEQNDERAVEEGIAPHTADAVEMAEAEESSDIAQDDEAISSSEEPTAEGTESSTKLEAEENYRPKSAERMALDEAHKEFSAAKKAYFSQEFLAQKKELAQLEAELKNPAHSARAKDEMRGRRDALFTRTEQIAYRYKEAKQPYAEALQEYLTKKETKSGNSLTPEQAKAMVGGRFFGKTKAERYRATGVMGKRILEENVTTIDTELNRTDLSEVEKEALRGERKQLLERIGSISKEHTNDDVVYSSYRERELALREAVLSLEQKKTFANIKEKFNNLNPKVKVAIAGAALGASAWNVGPFAVLAGLLAGAGSRLVLKKGGDAGIDALSSRNRQDRISTFDASNLAIIEAQFDKDESRERVAKQGVKVVATVGGIGAAIATGVETRGSAIESSFTDAVSSAYESVKAKFTGEGVASIGLDGVDGVSTVEGLTATPDTVILPDSQQPIVITLEPGQSGYVEPVGGTDTGEATTLAQAGDSSLQSEANPSSVTSQTEVGLTPDSAPQVENQTVASEMPMSSVDGGGTSVEAVRDPLTLTSAERLAGPSHIHHVPDLSQISPDAPAFEKARTVSDILFERWKVGQFDHLGWVPPHGSMSETEFLQVMYDAIHNVDQKTLEAMQITSGDIDTVYPGQDLNMVPILDQMFPPEPTSLSEVTPLETVSPPGEPELENSNTALDSTNAPIDRSMQPEAGIPDVSSRSSVFSDGTYDSLVQEARQRVMSTLSEAEELTLPAEVLEHRVMSEVAKEILADFLNVDGQHSEAVERILAMPIREIGALPAVPEGVDMDIAKTFVQYAFAQKDALSAEALASMDTVTIENLVTALTEANVLSVDPGQQAFVNPVTKAIVLDFK